MKTLKLTLSIISAIASAWFVINDSIAIGCYLLGVAIFLLLLPQDI